MKPRIRAVLVDARARPRPSFARALAAGARTKPAPAGSPGDVVLVETELYELLLEELPAELPLRARVGRSRGADLAIVVAGRATGDAARDLHVLHACGVRRAVTVVPADGPAALRESLGRDLLFEGELPGDDMPALSLAGDGASLGARELHALLDLVDATALPRVHAGFLAAVAGDGARPAGAGDGAKARLLWGALEERAPRALLFDDDATAGWRELGGVVDGVPARAGDTVTLFSPALDRAAGGIVAGAPLPLARVLHLSGLVRAPAPAGEACTAFGGAAGMSDGVLGGDGVLRLERPLAVVDGRVGLVRRFGFTRVTSTPAVGA